MKICKDCEISKPLNEFYKINRKKYPETDYYLPRCKKCHLDRFSPNRGKPNSGCFKKKNIPWCTGKKLSEAHCKKLSLAHMGHIVSNETKNKLAKIQRKRMEGRKHKPESIEKMKESLKKYYANKRFERERLEKLKLIGDNL